jgi:hypothetical protein
MNKELKFYGILGSDLDEKRWSEISPLLEDVLEFNDETYGLDDLYKGIKARQMQLWVAEGKSGIDAIWITMVICYPKSKRALIRCYVGLPFKEVIGFKTIFYDWARSQGCDAIEIYGRPGFARMMKNEGYAETHRLLRMKL